MSTAWRLSVLLFASLVHGAPAYASIMTFFGADDGVDIGGKFVNSAAAGADYQSAAAIYGSLNTHNFENRPLGFYSPISFGLGDASIYLSAPNLGPGYSGISNTAVSNQDGFSIAGASKKWLGFPEGSATFKFTSPSNAFGAFFTGLNADAGGTLTITFNDGAAHSLAVPVTINGGAEFFGFTDTSQFTSLTITRTGTDLFGLDGTAFTVANRILVPKVDKLSFDYDLAVVAKEKYYLDPEIAAGYTYATAAGNPNFASVTLPGLQKDPYELSYVYGGRSFDVELSGNEDFEFPADGVGAFTVKGIDPALALDASDPTAFVTAVSFVADGTFTGSQTPLVVGAPSVPLPTAAPMFGAAIVALGLTGIASRRKLHAKR